jgi:hypothetical protein
VIQDQNTFTSDTADQQTTMRQMADATGGQAFVNTNDLTRAVADAIDQGSNFYTLTYAPTDVKLDGKLRKIKIEAARSGLKLSYRRGYYADPPDKTTTDTMVSAATASDQATASDGISTRDTLRLAMMRGAPTPSDIQIIAGVVPASPDVPEDAPAPGNVPSEKQHGPWRRYKVNYQINPAGIVFFRTPDGHIHADVEMLIFVYSADGTLLNMVANAAHINDTPENVGQMLKQGLYCHEQISAPFKGESFLRIGIHDLHRDHYGAIEIATSQVKDLSTQPAQSSAPPASPATPPVAPATGVQK